MTLKYYHAEPAANSLKSMIPLIEKGLPYQSIYVDLHKFEQHADWFVAINPFVLAWAPYGPSNLVSWEWFAGALGGMMAISSPGPTTKRADSGPAVTALLMA